ncbi:hypothetical protein IWW54_003519 [Coemansia sp. RSA 2705]|nr:hypothetical protein IWW54_003519 [Coemansia sp. RSA 2705]
MSLVESADQPKWPTLAMVRKQLTAKLSLTDKILLSASLFCINFVAALDISTIGTVQPRVLSDFNAMTKVGAITVIMILLSAGIRPVFAKITETFGHLEALIVSVMFHVLGSLICALAKSFGAIFAGTVFSWLGQTGYSTLVALLVADTLPIHLRASVTAYISIPFVTNYYLGIEIANQLYDKWQWVYGILCILAFVCALPAVFSLLRLNRRARQMLKESGAGPQPFKGVCAVLIELDVPGLVLLSGGLIAVLAPLGLQLNSTYGWSSAQVIAPIVSGLLTLVAFIYYELRLARYPIVTFRLLKTRTFACAIMTALLIFFSFNVSLFFFTPYIQVTRDTSARTAMLLQQGTTGFHIGLFAGGWAMQFSKRYRRWVWLGWALCLLAICLMLRSRSGTNVTNAEIAAVQAILGLGVGIVVGCSGIGVQASVAKLDLTMAITLYGMCEYIGGVLGEAASTTIWVNVLPTKLEGRMPAYVDVQSAINNITYYQQLPDSQRLVVQDGYIATQKILTICGICSISLAAIAILGMAPFDLTTKDDKELVSTAT